MERMLTGLEAGCRRDGQLSHTPAGPGPAAARLGTGFAPGTVVYRKRRGTDDASSEQPPTRRRQRRASSAPAAAAAAAETAAGNNEELTVPGASLAAAVPEAMANTAPMAGEGSSAAGPSQTGCAAALQPLLPLAPDGAAADEEGLLQAVLEGALCGMPGPAIDRHCAVAVAVVADIVRHNAPKLLAYARRQQQQLIAAGVAADTSSDAGGSDKAAGREPCPAEAAPAAARVLQQLVKSVIKLAAAAVQQAASAAHQDQAAQQQQQQQQLQLQQQACLQALPAQPCLTPFTRGSTFPWPGHAATGAAPLLQPAVAAAELPSVHSAQTTDVPLGAAAHLQVAHLLNRFASDAAKTVSSTPVTAAAVPAGALKGLCQSGSAAEGKAQPLARPRSGATSTLPEAVCVVS
jgi:hypothetical protein